MGITPIIQESARLQVTTFRLSTQIKARRPSKCCFQRSGFTNFHKLKRVRTARFANRIANRNGNMVPFAD
jgi:hypothetical protein